MRLLWFVLSVPLFCGTFYFTARNGITVHEGGKRFHPFTDLEPIKPHLSRFGGGKLDPGLMAGLLMLYFVAVTTFSH